MNIMFSFLLFFTMIFNSFLEAENPIDLNINIVFVSCCELSNKCFLQGEIFINNNTNKTIKLPKSFDLKMIIMDKDSNIIIINNDVIDEFVNLINCTKSITIFKFDSSLIKFYDDRLDFYNLKKGETYFLQYIFKVNNYKNLRKQIEKNRIVSNIVEFTY